MENPYYVFWIDVIRSGKKNKTYSNNWKPVALFFFSYINSLNIAAIWAWINIFGGNIPLLKIIFLKGTAINSAIAYFTQFFLGIFIINYFLIFNNDRYLKYIDIYKDRKGKFGIYYTIISLLVAVFSAILYSILKFKLKVI